MRRVVACSLALAGLFSACDGPVDLSAAPAAVAKCEAPSADSLNPTAVMLPGRVCETCHTQGGEASRFIWTASGTVYDSPDSPCEECGLEGVEVDLLDCHDNVLMTLMTNRAGNFFTADPIGAPLYRVRLSKDGYCQQMFNLQSTGACASCHYPNSDAGTPGRVYLDNTPCN
jgi:hypothetical protein